MRSLLPAFAATSNSVWEWEVWGWGGVANNERRCRQSCRIQCRKLAAARDVYELFIVMQSQLGNQANCMYVPAGYAIEVKQYTEGNHLACVINGARACTCCELDNTPSGCTRFQENKTDAAREVSKVREVDNVTRCNAFGGNVLTVGSPLIIVCTCRCSTAKTVETCK
jgi:hypothetical protein